MKQSIINLKAPGNWINDPNGFIYYKGKYHLFYQYFPYGPYWGTMHWGHAVSDDLVKWNHLGIALMPTKAYDRNGIFSGSALEVDGKLNLYYTAVVYGKEDPENIHHSTKDPSTQSQAMLVSEDGFTFDNISDKKHIIPAITDTDIADISDCRDPKVFRAGNTYYMCLGSTHLKEKGVLLIYKSEDSHNWTYLNRLESETFGTCLECPDMFKLKSAIGEPWTIMCSPIDIMPKDEFKRITGDETGYSSNQSVFLSAEFNETTGEITVKDEKEYLDYGFDLYAPQSNLDKDGNRVYIAWARMAAPMKPDSNSASEGKNWTGMMSIPRVITKKNGKIYTNPHPGIREYFDKEATVTVDDGKTKMSCIGKNSRITTTIKEGQWLDIKGYKIGLINGKVVGDRSALVSEHVKIHRKSESPYVGDLCTLEIYYDPDMIEIFVNDGQYVLSHVTYDNVLAKKHE